MSIRAKILLGCLSLTLVTVVVEMLGRGSQAQLGTIALRLYDETFMSMSYLRSAQNTLVGIARDSAMGWATPASLSARLVTPIEDLEVARERAMSATARVSAERLRVELIGLAGELASRSALPDPGRLAAIELAFDETIELYAGDGWRSRRAAVELVRETSLRTWLTMAVSLLVAVAITIVLSRAIVPSVRRAVGIATAIAAGRLDNRIGATGRSETGLLLQALGQMQASIADKMARIEGLMVAQASHHASAIAASHVRFEAAVENMTQGLCMFDRRGRLLVHNRRFADMFGSPVALAEARDVVPPHLWDGEDAPSCSGGVDLRSFTRPLADGRCIAVSQQRMSDGGWVATYEDVSERLRTQARLDHMIRHDALTGLPNRVLYREYMAGLLAHAGPGHVAVLCVDLDDFQVVNDTLGHEIGDELLRLVGERLRAGADAGDLVVRLVGDEFAVVQNAMAQPSAARGLAERLAAAMDAPFMVAGDPIVVAASIGIALSTDGDASADGLLKSAHIALYRAKDDGRGRYRFFEAEMDAQVQARRSMELDLRRALAEEQIEVHYQPLVATETGRVTGFEALARWRHPERGMVSPAAFIPVAEEIGLIGALGQWVLNQACADAARWPGDVKVAVNLSPLQFKEPDLAGQVAAALLAAGLSPERLDLEITESVMMEDDTATLSILHSLRAMGVRISMDDFGTGYSSLSTLRRFPFDKIKIDQSFVRNLDENGDCLAIIRAVLGLGRSLGMRVIAEGVETTQQMAVLRQEGCQELQGYLFSPPRPVAEVRSLICRHGRIDA